jgi:hypothetical protein
MTEAQTKKTKTGECETKCQMCEKKEGLPILLTRYAIAPREAGAPQLGGDFKMKEAPPLGAATHYTQRLLRGGYVYVYNEAAEVYLQVYTVTPQGYLRPFLFDAKHGALSGKEPCNVHENGAVAGCLTIPVTRKTKEVWISFSDVLWTTEVYIRHLDAAYRARHMRRFDVKKWVSSLQHEHACKVKEVDKYVTEYAQGVDYRAFNFSPAFYAHRSAYHDLAPLARNAGFPDFKFPRDADKMPEIARKNGTTMERLMKDYQIPAAERLIRVFDRLYAGKGAVLTLDDPAGITMDVAALMSHRFDVFTNNPKDTYKLSISSAIVGLRALVHKQAEDDTYMASRKLQGMQGPIILATESGRKACANFDVTSEDLERAKKDAWKKYEEKYKESKRQSFQKDYDSKLQKFDQDYIVPLAKAHVEWMKSKSLADSFECNYDEKDPDSGVVYCAVFNLCLGDTQNVNLCFNLYVTWLESDNFADKKNLLLRALVLNQDEYVKLVEEAASAAQNAGAKFDWAKLWKGLIGQMGRAIGNVLKGDPDVLSGLIQQISGVLTKFVLAHASAGPLPRALLAIGAISRTPILRVEFTGTLERFQKIVVVELMQASGRQIPHGLEAAVKRSLDTLRIKGVKLDGERCKSFLALIDLDELSTVTEAGQKSQHEHAAALARAIKGGANAEDLEHIELSRWRRQIPEILQRTAKSLPFAASVMGAVLQIAAVHKLNEDLEKAATTEIGKEEAKVRLIGGTVALAGAAVGVLEKGQIRWPSITMRFGERVHGHLENAFKYGSRGLGALGGVILAVCDFWAGGKAWDKGQKGLAIAYYASSGIGAASAALILIHGFAAATVVGIVLVILAVGVAVLISALKDDPVQQWLENCIFGAHTYKTLEQEMKALEVAIS